MSDRLLNIGVALLSESKPTMRINVDKELSIRALRYLIEKAEKIIAALSAEPDNVPGGRSEIVEKTVATVPPVTLPSSSRLISQRASEIEPRAQKAVEAGAQAIPVSPETPVGVASPPQPPKFTPKAPTAMQRAAVRQEVQNVFDRFRMADGRAIGEIRFREYPHYFKQTNVTANVLKAIYRAHHNKPQDLTVRDVETADGLNALISRCERESVDAWNR